MIKSKTISVSFDARGLGTLYVRLIKERGEEEQIAEVHERSPHYVIYVRRAISVLHPPVHQRTYCHPHSHLGDLGGGDDDGTGFWHTESCGSDSVVAVHERVHGVIHGHEPAPTSHLVFVGIPGVNQHGDVVIPVQEDKPLFAQYNE